MTHTSAAHRRSITAWWTCRAKLCATGRRGALVTATAAVLGLAATGARAEESTPAAPPIPAAAALTATDVNTWLDGYLPYALQTGDIAGAVVVVVKDGEVLTERGYGYADVAARKPVDPKLTLFRPGSVSKLVTWTLFSVAVLLLTAVFWPVTAWMRRSYRAPLLLMPAELKAYRLSRIGAILISRRPCGMGPPGRRRSHPGAAESARRVAR